jgi:MYXO-CTERM domain-containing protein
MRTPALSTALVLAALTLSSVDARADVLPPNHKGVKLSVKVEPSAEVPASKQLILTNTFEGADVVRPGEVQPVNWHPMGGDMQLRLIDAAMVAKIEPLRAERDRDAITQLVEPSPTCGDEIRGIRTISEQSSAEEVRWTIAVTIEGEECSAEIRRMDYLDAAGEQVPTPMGAPPGTPPEPRAAQPPSEATPADDSPAAPAPATTPQPTSSDDKAAGCGCRADEGEAAGLGLLGLLFGALRRRRRRR